METEDKAKLLAALGKTIQKLRLERNMSQDELAEAAELHRNFVSHIERGNKQPTYITIFRLAYAFGLKPSELLQQVEDLIKIE